ncbi:MAG: hypothetical protein ACR2P0_14305 [Acidimicrobiales bacterium]
MAARQPPDVIMFGLLIEGIESLRLPCSWVLVIPGIAVTLAARSHFAIVVATFFGVVSLVAWLRFAGYWYAVPDWPGQIALGLAILAAAGVAWWFDRRGTSSLSAAVTGVAATWVWIPCVGDDLAIVLNGARTGAAGHIGGTIAFFVGLLVPLILWAALGYADPWIGKRWSSRPVMVVGSALLIIVGVLFVTTLFDDVASELARRSSF